MRKFSAAAMASSSGSSDDLSGATNEKARKLEAEKAHYESKCKSIDQSLVEFKLEKKKLVDDHRLKIAGNSNSELEEHRTAKEGLQQVHQARVDKVPLSFLFCPSLKPENLTTSCSTIACPVSKE